VKKRDRYIKKVKYRNGRRLCDDIDPSQIIMTAFQNGW
jgi:hypothetical protein